MTRLVLRRARTRLREPSTGWPSALASGLLWVVVGGSAAWGALSVAILTSPIALRATASVALALLSTVALMLASDSFARSLAGHGGRWAGVVQWWATSVVTLAVVVVLGAPATVLAPDGPRLQDLAIDLVIDVGVGALSGTLAVVVIMFTARWAGHLICCIQGLLGREARAQRWKRPEAHDGGTVSRHLRRGAALGTAGLLLSAVCTVVVTKAASSPIGAADSAPSKPPGPLLAVLLPIVCWFVATGTVWHFFARRSGEKLAPHHRMRHATHANALSVCLMILLAWGAGTAASDDARRQLGSDRPQKVPSLPIRDPQASLQSPYLARQFEPQLQLTSGEPWTPTSVAWYVRHSEKSWVPPSCNEGGCYRLSPPHHSRGARDPQPFCDDPHPGTCAARGADDPALYYRYIDPGNDQADGLPSAAAGHWTIIEYWAFYNYDSLDTPVITQWHQADWEQVSVLVQQTFNTIRPVEVAFSEHCYGARLPANRVSWNGTHPRVYVALGSHANYPRTVSEPVRELQCGVGLAQRYLGVAGLFFTPALNVASLEVPLAYFLGLRDRTDGKGPEPALRLISLDEARNLPTDARYWGLDNNLRLLDVGPLRSAAAPAPRHQCKYQTPFRSMLCSESWLSMLPSPIPNPLLWCPSGTATRLTGIGCV